MAFFIVTAMHLTWLSCTAFQIWCSGHVWYCPKEGSGAVGPVTVLPQMTGILCMSLARKH